MGGQNHQPTRSIFTAVSAWLSQRVGEGFAVVLEANNYLEDAIILGMDKLYVEELAPRLSGSPSDHLQKTIGALQRSQKILAQIQLGFSKLLEVARTEGYIGNPLASQLKAFDLSSKFGGVLLQPSVNPQVWHELERRISEDNILKTLEWEASEFDRLIRPTADLIAVMQEGLRLSEREGGRAFVDAVENNELPLRQYYAQVFSLWNYVHAMFLYSALMMTELFYRANAYPSLLEFDLSKAKVYAA